MGGAGGTHAGRMSCHQVPGGRSGRVIAEIEAFLQHFSDLESYHVSRSQVAPPACSQLHSRVNSPMPLTTSLALDDPNCEKAWKGKSLGWDLILENVERLLRIWAGGEDPGFGSDLS